MLHVPAFPPLVNCESPTGVVSEIKRFLCVGEFPAKTSTCSLLFTARVENELQEIPYYVATEAPFIWRKVVPGRRVTRLPELPWASQLFIHFLSKLSEQKVGSARRVTRLAGSPFCDGRVTLLAEPTFLHINTLARLAGSTPTRRDIQNMREICFQLLARAMESTFISYKRSVKLTRLGGLPSCPGQLFSI